MSRKGFHLNQFCMSLMKEDNRTRFRADERRYLDEWPLSPQQRSAILRRDYTSMIVEGGNIYFLVKIGSSDGLSVQKVVASMTDLNQVEYAAMMLAGGRSPHGNRSLGEQNSEQN
jgi:protocatechuate 4,5-dioxygenase alpha chain